MKKVFMIAALMIAALGANAQDKVEIKAGVGVAQINGINQDSKVGFNLGIGYQMNLDGNVYVEPSVMYENKGFKSKGLSLLGYTLTSDRTYYASYLTVPVVMGVRMPLTQGVNFALEAGPYASLEMGGTDQYFDESGAKDWDLGLTAGGKFEFGDYRVGAYYNYGLMHVWPGAGHNMTYGISLGYAF